MGSNGICVPPVNPGSIPVGIGVNPGPVPVDVGENPGSILVDVGENPGRRRREQRVVCGRRLRLSHVPTDRLAERLRPGDGVSFVDDLAANDRQLREDAL